MEGGAGGPGIVSIGIDRLGFSTRCFGLVLGEVVLHEYSGGFCILFDEDEFIIVNDGGAGTFAGGGMGGGPGTG